jgi:ABC-2 type transport system permease protein
MRRFLLAVGTLFQREVVRFLRQKNRVIGALGTPLVFWFLIGSGLGTSFAWKGGSGGMSYLQYFFPGTILLILLFTAIFSTISIIEDRREGFLQAVLVAPVDRSAIVLGKLLGGTVLAFGQGLLFLALLPLLKLSLGWGDFVLVCAVMALLSFALTGLGFLIAWRLDSTQGFHAIMNLLLMPLWFLSGAIFPAEGAPGWLRALMKVNPLGYGLAALQRAFFQGAGVPPGTPSPALCLGVTTVFAAVMFALALGDVRRTEGAA